MRWAGAAPVRSAAHRAAAGRHAGGAGSGDAPAILPAPAAAVPDECPAPTLRYRHPAAADAPAAGHRAGWADAAGPALPPPPLQAARKSVVSAKNVSPRRDLGGS